MYRYTNSSGQVTYSDTMPVSAGKLQVDVIENGKVIKTISSNPYDDAKSYINISKKHIPKTLVYIEYIEYLMKHNPVRYHTFVEEMKLKDVQTYAKLHKAGLFGALNTGQRLSNALDLTVGVFDEVFLTGKPGTAAVKWSEKTLTDYMKKDGFLPRDVLGSKATTLPQHVPHYSSSRLGQWSQAEDVKAVAAAKATQKALGGRPVLTAAGTAASRVGGAVLGIGIEMLNPEVANSAGREVLRRNAKNLYEKGVIDEIGWARSQELLSQGKYVEMQRLMTDATNRYVGGGAK